MNALIIRLGVLALVTICTWLAVLLGKRFVATRRRRAFTATPLTTFSTNTVDTIDSKIRILSFSSEDCHQCKLQAPILQRIVEAHKDAISITEIDAPAEPELSTHYQVLTVPTTVVLDTDGKVHAINYGFANTEKLLKQIDTLLTASI